METSINLWTSPLINDPKFYHHEMIVRLSEAFGVSPRVDYENGRSGVHVLMVLARWLFVNQEWFKGLTGPKVIVEHDAYLNFMPSSPYFGKWTELYRNCNFDLIISSGKETTERLRDQGLPAVWVPKGSNSGFLGVDNRGEGRLGYFSLPIAERETGRKFYFYQSRHEMCSMVESLIDPIACEVEDFPSTVSGFSGVVTNDETMREPMAKQFECSALGAVVIRERRPELLDLGYRDGESVIFYDRISDLPDIVDFYSKNPELLIEMGKNARIVASGATWKHRAKQVAKWVLPYLPGRIYA